VVLIIGPKVFDDEEKAEIAKGVKGIEARLEGIESEAERLCEQIEAESAKYGKEPEPLLAALEGLRTKHNETRIQLVMHTIVEEPFPQPELHDNAILYFYTPSHPSVFRTEVDFREAAYDMSKQAVFPPDIFFKDGVLMDDARLAMQTEAEREGMNVYLVQNTSPQVSIKFMQAYVGIGLHTHWRKMHTELMEQERCQIDYTLADEVKNELEDWGFGVVVTSPDDAMNVVCVRQKPGKTKERPLFTFTNGVEGPSTEEMEALLEALDSRGGYKQ
jgi:hypothetical protein